MLSESLLSYLSCLVINKPMSQAGALANGVVHLFVCLLSQMHTCRALVWLAQQCWWPLQQCCCANQPVPDILTAAGAYCVGHSGPT